MSTSRPLSRKEASDYLHDVHGIRRSPETLAKLACVGGGPGFRKAGRAPLYDPPSLDAWADKITSPTVHSTSQLNQRNGEAA